MAALSRRRIAADQAVLLEKAGEEIAEPCRMEPARPVALARLSCFTVRRLSLPRLPLNRSAEFSDRISRRAFPRRWSAVRRGGRVVEGARLESV